MNRTFSNEKGKNPQKEMCAGDKRKGKIPFLRKFDFTGVSALNSSKPSLRLMAGPESSKPGQIQKKPRKTQREILQEKENAELRREIQKLRARLEAKK